MNPALSPTELPCHPTNTNELGIWGFLKNANVCTMSIPIKHYYHSTFSFLLQEIPLDNLDWISRKSNRLRLKIVTKVNWKDVLRSISTLGFSCWILGGKWHRRTWGLFFIGDSIEIVWSTRCPWSPWDSIRRSENGSRNTYREECTV